MTYRFVFEARIKRGCTDDQYVAAWSAGSEIIQREPGALGTQLYRKEPGVLVAIASWESKADREAAMTKLGSAEGAGQDTYAVLQRHLEFADITPVFGLEEIGSVPSASSSTFTA